jgi:hypothetical protein
VRRRVGARALALALVACEGGGGETPKTPAPATTPSGAPAAPGTTVRAVDVDALWRESVQYRSAHLALADNAAGLARDVERSARMLETVEATRRVPVVTDVAADGRAVETALRAYLKRLRLRADVTVQSPLPPIMPEPEIDAAVGLAYSLEQIGGAHDVTVTFGQGFENGPKFFGDLNAIGRLTEPVSARIGDDGQAVVKLRVHFFRDVQPVKFVRKPPPFAARAALVTDPTETEKPRLADIQANLAQVEAVAAQIEAAYAQQALLKISTTRFRYYSEAVERYNKASWAAVLAR